jgi:hypothetical protein
MIKRLQCALGSFAALFGEDNATIRFDASRTTGTQKYWTLVRFGAGSKFVLSYTMLNQRDAAARLESLSVKLKEIQTATVKVLLPEMSAAAVDALHDSIARDPKEAVGKAARLNWALQGVLKGFLRPAEGGDSHEQRHDIPAVPT